MLAYPCYHPFAYFELIPGFSDASRMEMEEWGLFHGGRGECSVPMLGGV